MNGDAAKLEAFLEEMRAEFPRFRIVEKRGDTLSRVIDRALRLVTLGGQNAYISRYHTVIGDTLYVPDGWKDTDPIDAIITLRHERVHLRQRRRYTMAGMTFLYFVPFMPIGLAYGRAHIEWEAYRETLRATHELRGEGALRSPSMRRRIVEQFVGPAYGWMWPFRGQVERWYDEAVETIAAG